jgi:hypothetical protein
MQDSVSSPVRASAGEDAGTDNNIATAEKTWIC